MSDMEYLDYLDSKYKLTNKIKQSFNKINLRTVKDDDFLGRFSSFEADLVSYYNTKPLVVFFFRKDYDIEEYYEAFLRAKEFVDARFFVFIHKSLFYTFNSLSSIEDDYIQMNFEELYNEFYEIIASTDTLNKIDISNNFKKSLVHFPKDMESYLPKEFLDFINKKLSKTDFKYENITDTFYFSNPEIEQDFFNKLLEPYTKDHLCRYTSLNSMFESLRFKTFRMFSVTGMNDKSEVSYFNDYVYNDRKITPINKIPYKKVDAINKRFILSCVDKEKIDNLTLWRLYGDDARGICYVYSVNKVQKNYGFYLYNVDYADKDGKHAKLEYIKLVLENIKKEIGSNFRFNKTYSWEHFFKPYEYKDESEVRLLFMQNISAERNMKVHNGWLLTHPHKILAPYVDLPIDNKIFPLVLRKIILGPKCYETNLNTIQLKNYIFRDVNLKQLQLDIEPSGILNYR